MDIVAIIIISWSRASPHEALAEKIALKNMASRVNFEENLEMSGPKWTRFYEIWELGRRLGRRRSND